MKTSEIGYALAEQINEQLSIRERSFSDKYLEIFVGEDMYVADIDVNVEFSSDWSDTIVYASVSINSVILCKESGDDIKINNIDDVQRIAQRQVNRAFDYV